jgi:hypothetical protein
MDEANWIALFSAVLTCLASLGGVFAYLQNSINANAERLSEEIEALRRDLEKDIERGDAMDRSARDRMAADVQKLIADIQVELGRMRDNSATRNELQTMESRLNFNLGKLEVRLDKVDTKLEPLPAMHAILMQLNSAVERRV